MNLQDLLRTAIIQSHPILKSVEIKLDDQNLLIDLTLPKDQNPTTKLAIEIKETARNVLGVGNYLNPIVSFLTEQVAPSSGNEKPEHKPKSRINGINKILVVASGKGGVGKSTIASNIAVALQSIGWRAGILDADIYGASIPTIFDIEGPIEVTGGGLMKPIESRNICINSVGFVTEVNEALIWRGPLISKALMKLMLKTEWTFMGDLDYLIIDTPPGTGDIHLSLLENFQIDGYLLVSTPHKLSIQNTLRAHNMFETFGIKNCGFVFNMCEASATLETLKIPVAFQKNIPLINSSQSLLIEDPKYSSYFVELARELVRVMLF